MKMQVTETREVEIDLRSIPVVAWPQEAKKALQGLLCQFRIREAVQVLPTKEEKLEYLIPRVENLLAFVQEFDTVEKLLGELPKRKS